MGLPLHLPGGVGIAHLVILAGLCFASAFAAPSVQIRLYDILTNGSRIIETEPVTPEVIIIRVAPPPTGRWWRVTVAANCTTIRGRWARGTIPEVSNLVQRSSDIEGLAATAPTDAPGSFQVVIHSPFDTTGGYYFFQLFDFLDEGGFAAIFPLQVSVTYQAINRVAPSFPVGQVMTLPLSGSLDRPTLVTSWIPSNPPFWGIHYRLLSGLDRQAYVTFYPNDDSESNEITALREGIPHFLNIRSAQQTGSVYDNDVFVYSRVDTITPATAPGVLNVDAVADLPVLIAVTNTFPNEVNTNITMTITNTTYFEGDVTIEVMRANSDQPRFISAPTGISTTFNADMGSKSIIFPRSNRFSQYYYLRVRYLPTTITAQTLAAMTQRAGIRLSFAAAETTMVPLSVGQTLSGAAKTMYNFSAEASAAVAGQYMLRVISTANMAVGPMSTADPLSDFLGYTALIFSANVNYTMFPACPDFAVVQNVVRITSAGSVTLYREDPPTLTYPSSFITNSLARGSYLFKLPAGATYPLKVTMTVVSGSSPLSDFWYSGQLTASICPSRFLPVCRGDCSFYVTCPDEVIFMTRSQSTLIQYNITLESVTPPTVSVSRNGRIELDLPTIRSALFTLQVNDSSQPVTIASSDRSLPFRVRSASTCNRPSFASFIHAPVSSGMLIEVGSPYLPPIELFGVNDLCSSRIEVPFYTNSAPFNQKLEDAFYSFSISFSHINTSRCYQFMLNETCRQNYVPCVENPPCYEECMNRAFDAGCSVNAGSAVCQVLGPCPLPDAPVASSRVLKFFAPPPVAAPAAAPVAAAVPVAAPTSAPSSSSSPVAGTGSPTAAPLQTKAPVGTTAPKAVNSSSSLAITMSGLILVLLCVILM